MFVLQIFTDKKRREPQITQINADFKKHKRHKNYGTNSKWVRLVILAFCG